MGTSGMLQILREHLASHGPQRLLEEAMEKQQHPVPCHCFICVMFVSFRSVPFRFV